VEAAREGAPDAPGNGTTVDAGPLAWESAAARFEAAPPLAGLAALGSVADLLLNTVFVRSLPASFDHQQRLDAVAAGDFVRNLAAVAGLGTLLFLVIDLIRTRGWAPPTRRVVFASFAGLFLPAAALAVVLPHAQVTREIVFAAIAGGTVLAVLLALTAVRFPAPGALRFGLGLLGLSTLLSFTAWTAAAVVGARAAETTQALRSVAEIAHLASLPLIAFAVAPLGDKGWRGQVGRGLGALLGLVVLGAYNIGRVRLGNAFPELFYGVTRWSLFIEDAPLVYGYVLAVTTALLVTAVVAGDASQRQGGIAVALLIRGGLAPRTIAGALALVLGTGLVARAAIGTGTRRMADRERARRRVMSRLADGP